MKPVSHVRMVGRILLIFGVLCLLCGILLLAVAASTIGFWIVIASILLNIVGISLMTLKKY